MGFIKKLKSDYNVLLFVIALIKGNKKLKNTNKNNSKNMKHLTIILGLILSSLLSNSQTNFEWEVKKDIDKTQEQLYSDTKMYIAMNWKSANDVIQNDSKECIIIKGITIQEYVFILSIYKYVYSYTIMFNMKDGKYRMILKDVYNTRSIAQGKKNKLVQPFEDGQPVPKNFLPKKHTKLMMVNLKKDMQSIVDRYVLYMDKESKQNDDW